MGLTRDFKETVQNRINRDPEFREELLKEETRLVHQTIKKIFKNFRGILAADESDGTIANRLGSVGQESTPETRHSYRHTIFSTPDLKKSVGGVILFDETLRNEETIAPLIENDIVLGIKVDKGAKPYFVDSNETLTEGLDGLDQRLVEYKELGAQFAKWRAVLLQNNSPQGLLANCWTLARYAKKCQSHGIIPIVEPEVLMNGIHSIEDSYRITRQVLHILFDALHYEDVELEHTILKPNMIVSGYQSKDRADAETVAKMTVKCLRNEVPCALPAIAFLSGGQSDDEAIENLSHINRLDSLSTDEEKKPWRLSFSFGRAMQSGALKLWSDGLIKEAQNWTRERGLVCQNAVRGY